MPPPAPELSETILQTCLRLFPEAWYPHKNPLSPEIPTEEVDRTLNDLRMLGLINLTDWKAGVGQGYQITPLGIEIAQNPLFLKRLREESTLSLPHSDEPTSDPATNSFEQGERAREGLFNTRTGPIVLLLLIANIVMYLVTLGLGLSKGVPFQKLMLGDGATLDQLGSVSAPGIARGEYWRLVSAAFLHLGPFHLIINMIALFSLRNSESFWGSRRFLLIYLISALCGSCLAVIFDPGTPDRVMNTVGASGALCGIFTAWAVAFYLNRDHFNPEIYQARMTNILINGILILGISFIPGVSLVGHLGGALAGGLLGMLMRAHMFSPASRRSFIGIQIALIPTTAMMLLAGFMESDPRLKPFITAEKRERTAKVQAKLLEVLQPVAQEWQDITGKMPFDPLFPFVKQSPDWPKQEEALRQFEQSIPEKIQQIRSLKLPVEDQPLQDKAIEILTLYKELAKLTADDPDDREATLKTRSKLLEATLRFQSR